MTNIMSVISCHQSSTLRVNYYHCHVITSFPKIYRHRPINKTHSQPFPQRPHPFPIPNNMHQHSQNLRKQLPQISLPSSPRPLTRPFSPPPSPTNAGPRLTRASSSTATRTHPIRPSPNHRLGPLIKDGNFDEIEKSAMNITAIADTLVSGNEDQITLALFETQQVLEVSRDDAINTLVPIICQKLVHWTPPIQTSAAETLLIVVSSKVPAALAKTITDTAFEVIRTSPDTCICEIWGQTLVGTLPHVSWSPKELDELVDQLQLTRPGNSGAPRSLRMSRQLTARVLGSIAMCSKGLDIKKRIMHRAMVLANDEDVEVRGMVAESMSFIGASINISIVEQELWPVISKLVQDKNARVHAASMRTISFIAVAHVEKSPDSNLYRLFIPPILLKECAKIRKAAESDQRTVDDDTYLLLEINSEIFGKLLHSCWRYMPDDVARKDAFKAFLAMSTCNGPIVRKYCAFNLPGVSKCFIKRHSVEMSCIVEFLSRDAEPETRYLLASGIHQTVKILAGRDTINNLFKAVLALLQDENALVRKSTLQHFEELIAQLSKHMGYNSVRKLEQIFQNLHLLSEGNWRTQELLSRQLLLAAPLVPPPSIRSNVLPLLYKLAEQSSFLVRKAAMAAVATCMRYIPDTLEREKAMASFRTDWANGAIYWMRIGFIDSAKSALDSYSRCLFRDTFASEVLRLADDPVPNVRIRVALILPFITSACHQMMEFQNAIERLKRDSDKDVQDAIKGIDDRIASILEKRREGFEEDMRKEEEERDLYSKYLNARKEGFRKKKGTNIKRAKTMLLKRSSRVLPLSASRSTTSNERTKDKENNAANNQTDPESATKAALPPKESFPELRLSRRVSSNLEKKEGSKTWKRSKSSFTGRRGHRTSLLDSTRPEETTSASNSPTSAKKTEAAKPFKGLPKKSRSFILRRS